MFFFEKRTKKTFPLQHAILRLHGIAVLALPDAGTTGSSPRRRRSAEGGITTWGSRNMGKGNKQHGNREAKKPKANKKVAPVSSTFLKPQPDVAKPGAKPAPK